MKKGRFLCIALALSVMLTLTSYAAEAPAYTTRTLQSHNGVVFTFEAARKISLTVSYDDTANDYIEENAEVYLVKPGSSVTVKTTDGADTEYMCMHYVQTDSGHYNALSVEYNRLRSGSVDAWFELSDMAKITTERVTEPVQLEGWNMTWDRVISERTVYVMPDDGSSDTTQPGGTGTAFADVAADAYYADAVAWAVEKGITTGISATSFSPERTCTTEEILTFLWRANGSPASSSEPPFDVVEVNDYYGDAVRWAYEQGLISDDGFLPGAPATRAATVTYLWKLSGRPSTAPAAFTDVDADAEYAQAVAWAVEQGVTTGTGAGDTFSPDVTCTRGQIVTFLHRYLGE